MPDNRMFALVGGPVVSEGRLVSDGRVVVVDGCIAAIGADVRAGELPIVDVGGRIVAPGLIDIHTHGARGYCFNGCARSDVAEILRTHARHGVTAVVPTLVTAPIDELRSSIETLAAFDGADSAARIVAVHLEGPCLAPSQRGAHAAEYLRHPDDLEVEALLIDVSCEKLVVTLAPELPGALSLVRRLADRSAIVAAGHSEATAQELRAAEAEGLSHVVHLWSGQSTITRRGPWRVPGLLEGALASETLTAEVIADGKHLPPELLTVALRCVSPERLCVVSDSTPGAGLSEGASYSLGNVECIVADGVGLVSGDEGTFGGSTTFLDEMLSVLIRDGGIGIERAISMATEVPARVLRLSSKGSIRRGADADIVVLNADLSVHQTFIAGTAVDSLGALPIDPGVRGIGLPDERLARPGERP